MATMNLPPVLYQRYFTANGVSSSGAPLSGGKVWTYQAGTTTPQATYTDQGGLTANTNPIILDANGQCDMWLDPSLSYKFVIKDSADVVQKTVDNVVGLATANAVNTASLQPLCVTTAKMALNSVDSTILASDATVDANRAVQTNHIRDLAVTAGKLADGAVTRAKLANQVVQAKTANFTAAATDDVYFCDATSGSITVTLPSAASNSGKYFIFKKTDAAFNTVTIGTVDGASKVLTVPNESIEIISDGTNWKVHARSYSKAWTSYTQAITATTTGPNKGTITRDVGLWRKVSDDSVELWWIYKATTGGTTGTGTYLFTLPNSWAGNTSTLAVDTDGIGSTCGFWSASDRSTTDYIGGIASLYDSTHLAVYSPSSGLWNSASGLNFSAGNVRTTIRAIVPISGWA